MRQGIWLVAEERLALHRIVRIRVLECEGFLECGSGLGAFAKSDAAKWGKVIRDAGMKAQ